VKNIRVNNKNFLLQLSIKDISNHIGAGREVLHCSHCRHFADEGGGVLQIYSRPKISALTRGEGDGVLRQCKDFADKGGGR